MDATSVEILALREAIFLFKASMWSKTWKLILQTDCAVCGEWLCNPTEAPNVFKGTVMECLKVCPDQEWSIFVISRAANATAVKLAKGGISRSAPLLWNKMVEGELVS
ncbi:hypothetical protein V6N11_062127 [Hibiscus sabdariffa]|uniref:RNase H type-1 domain-containing protein n=1 Tax=Hibiscus sabdariffa TaxID=183260 RepID=A0ABR2PRM8_9ROSI